MTPIKRLLIALTAGLAVAAGAAPAWALPDQAGGGPACAYQQQSPSCRPVPEPPGTDIQHNETLIRDIA
jgi:hypothetical protein